MADGLALYATTAGARTDAGHWSGSSGSTLASPGLLPVPQRLCALGLSALYCSSGFPYLNNFGLGACVCTCWLHQECDRKSRGCLPQFLPGGCLTDAADH